jgi:hypothetical protein
MERDRLQYLSRIDIDFIYHNYEPIIEKEEGPINHQEFTEQNIKDYYSLRCNKVKNSVRVSGNKADADSILKLIGGFEGLASLLAEIATMKNTIKRLEAQLPQQPR